MEVVGANSLMMFCVKVFGKIICKIFLAGMPGNVKIAKVNLICNPKKFFSIVRDRCFLTVLFVIDTAVLLSQCTGVAGWGWPSSSRVRRKTVASWQLLKRALSSASAAEATTNLHIPAITCTGPLSWMGHPLTGNLPRKKIPPIRLRALGSER